MCNKFDPLALVFSTAFVSHILFLDILSLLSALSLIFPWAWLSGVRCPFKLFVAISSVTFECPESESCTLSPWACLYYRISCWLVSVFFTSIVFCCLRDLSVGSIFFCFCESSYLPCRFLLYFQDFWSISLCLPEKKTYKQLQVIHVGWLTFLTFQLRFW